MDRSEHASPPSPARCMAVMPGANNRIVSDEGLIGFAAFDCFAIDFGLPNVLSAQIVFCEMHFYAN